MVEEAIAVNEPSARVDNVCKVASVAALASAHNGHPDPTTTHPTLRVPAWPADGVTSISGDGTPVPAAAVRVGAVNELAAAKDDPEQAMMLLSVVLISAAKQS